MYGASGASVIARSMSHRKGMSAWQAHQLGRQGCRRQRQAAALRGTGDRDPVGVDLRVRGGRLDGPHRVDVEPAEVVRLGVEHAAVITPGCSGPEAGAGMRACRPTFHSPPCARESMTNTAYPAAAYSACSSGRLRPPP